MTVDVRKIIAGRRLLVQPKSFDAIESHVSLAVSRRPLFDIMGVDYKYIAAVYALRVEDTGHSLTSFGRGGPWIRYDCLGRGPILSSDSFDPSWNAGSGHISGYLPAHLVVPKPPLPATINRPRPRSQVSMQSRVSVRPEEHFGYPRVKFVVVGTPEITQSLNLVVVSSGDKCVRCGEFC